MTIEYTNGYAVEYIISWDADGNLVVWKVYARAGHFNNDVIV